MAATTTKKFDFSLEDIEKIRRLNAEGKSQRAIGAEFGCGYGPIQRVYRELGIKPQVEKALFSEQDIEHIKQMLIEEVSVKNIGKAFGKSQTPILRLLKDLGLKPTAKRLLTDDEMESLKKLHAEGKTQNEIATILDRGQSSISRAYQKLGLIGNIGKVMPFPEKIDEVVAVWNETQSVKETAAKLGIGLTTVGRALDKRGIEISQELTEAEKERIITLRQAGMTIKEIAIETDRGISTVLKYLHEAGFSGNLPRAPESISKTCNVCNITQSIDEFDKVNQTFRNDECSYTRRAVCRACWLLRKSISQAIKVQLEKSLSSKDGASCLAFLPYTILELRQHLESLFEPWMTWKNWGHYKMEDWDDNDPGTWVWHIDHIIPHANFKYTSMNDDLFKECWALSNLRPYSAKQNVRDNDRGLRKVNQD